MTYYVYVLSGTLNSTNSTQIRLPGKTCLRNDLLCVECDVMFGSTAHSLADWLV